MRFQLPLFSAVAALRRSRSTERARLPGFLRLSRFPGWTCETSCVSAGGRAPLRGTVRGLRLLRSTARTCPGSRWLCWRRVAAQVTRRCCAPPPPLSGGEVGPSFRYPAKLAVSQRYLRFTGPRPFGGFLVLCLRPVAASLFCTCFHVRLLGTSRPPCLLLASSGSPRGRAPNGAVGLRLQRPIGRWSPKCHVMVAAFVVK